MFQINSKTRQGRRKLPALKICTNQGNKKKQSKKEKTKQKNKTEKQNKKENKKLQKKNIFK